MTSGNAIAWLFAAVWANSLNQAEAGGPAFNVQRAREDLCKDIKRIPAAGEWVDHSIDIPGEQAPDNKLAIRVRCQEKISMERYFDRCEAKLTDKVQEFEAKPTKHPFAGKSGKWHALLCPQRAEPKVVPTFAAEVCKSGIAAVKPTRGAQENISVEFKCSDDKAQIASCKADTQADWAKADGESGYFGGKSGKLFSIICRSHDLPDISASYARDICHGEQKDEVDVQNGKGPITVFFDCNEPKGAFVTCYPKKKTAKRAVTAREGPGNGNELGFDIALMGGSFKLITCYPDEKPDIRKIDKTIFRAPSPCLSSTGMTKS